MALKPLAPLLRGYHVVLASASPRRREILDLAGVVFDVIPSHFSEVPSPEHMLRPQDLVIANAKGKALDVGMRLSQADPETQHLIIGADTIVAMEGQIMGKPCDREDALRMLTRLNGREHSVITGVAIILTGGAGTRDTEVVVVFHEETLVTFSKLSDELVQEHVEGGEPWDKAGGYGLQARGGAIMAEAVRGDPLNAAGLPLNRLCRELGRRLLPLGPGQEVESQT